MLIVALTSMLLATAASSAPDSDASTGARPNQASMAGQSGFASSRVLSGKLMLRSGERAIVTYDDAMVPTLVRVEPAGSKSQQPVPTGAIIYELTDTGSGPVLMTTNGRDQLIRYHVLLLRFDGDRIVQTPTTICPLLPKGFSTESWAAPVPALGVVRVEADTDNNMACIK